VPPRIYREETNLRTNENLKGSDGVKKATKTQRVLVQTIADGVRDGPMPEITALNLKS